MFGKLSPSEIEELLNQQFVGRIGCHANETTYVVPISYAYDGTYVYGHALEGKKIDMMRNNPNDCFEVDNTRYLSNWQSVIAMGIYEELAKGPEWNEAMQKLEARAFPVLTSETMRLHSQWPFPSGNADNITGIVFRIRLIEKSGRFEKSDGQYYYAT